MRIAFDRGERQQTGVIERLSCGRAETAVSTKPRAGEASLSDESQRAAVAVRQRCGEGHSGR
jgi:hypothetical protein